MSLQPSLATDAVQLVFASQVTGSLNIRVFDAAGKVVLAETRNDLTERCEIPVNNLKNGLYFILVQSADKAANGRFVKQD